MKWEEVRAIINKADRQYGYRISFEWYGDGFLRSDYFPERDETLIESENTAWKIAKMFANRMKGKVCNVYVTDQDYMPVREYKNKMIKNR